MVYVNKTYRNLFSEVFHLILYQKEICLIKIIALTLKEKWMSVVTNSYENVFFSQSLFVS
jgi:hypothetical protein